MFWFTNSVETPKLFINNTFPKILCRKAPRIGSPFNKCGDEIWRHRRKKSAKYYLYVLSRLLKFIHFIQILSYSKNVTDSFILQTIFRYFASFAMKSIKTVFLSCIAVRLILENISNWHKHLLFPVYGNLPRSVTLLGLRTDISIIWINKIRHCIWSLRYQ